MQDIASAEMVSGQVVRITLADGTQIFDRADLPPNTETRRALREWISKGGRISEPRPQPPPVPDVITRRQWLIALAAAGVLTPEEAIAAARGIVPAAFEAAFEKLPRDAATAARITWGAMTTVRRGDPLVDVMISERIATPEQVDTIFRQAATL